MPGTKVIWAPPPAPDWGTLPGDPSPSAASLNTDAAALAGAPLRRSSAAGRVAEPLQADGRFAVVLRNGEVEAVEVDRILSLTASVGDHGLYRQLQVHECYATCGPIKLPPHSRGGRGLPGADHPWRRHPEKPGAELLHPREPSPTAGTSFLMRIGWKQVEEVFASLLP